MAGYEHRGRPTGWVENGGEVYCLACCRALAAEAGVDAAPSDTTLKHRAQLRTEALIEFEVSRDPERSDSEIARAIRTSVPAVVKARERLKAE
jgi:8-oxo-dGTP pyrophosphatase MutT (NUDIX family)